MVAARHAAGTVSGLGMPARARLAGLLAALTLLVVLPGCVRKARISGTINATSYVSAAGQIVTAVGDVTIIASHRIEIDGVLEVAHGATVTFQSPTVNIPGTVQNQDTYVGWWVRSKFLLNRLPGILSARLDRMLGRAPNYWGRGTLDCFNPVGRATALSAAPTGKGPRKPGWRWKKKLAVEKETNASVEGRAGNTRP